MSQPIRSAITVAGIVGTACSNSRIRGSTVVHDRPAHAAARTSAARRCATPPCTVFLLIPITRAIALIGISSARCSRRISAQSSTESTYSLPSSTSQGVGQGVNFQMPSGGRPAGSGGRYTGRNSATRPDRTRIDRVQPIRSAITVAGIDGCARSNSRIRGSTASTTDPAGLRAILRRLVRGQRSLHRVPADPHDARDRRDRHLLGPMQPADLRPVLHVQAPTSSPARLEPGCRRRWSNFRCHAGFSFQPPSTSRTARTDGGRFLAA